MKSFGSLVLSALLVVFVTTTTIGAAPPTECEMTKSVETCMGELLKSQKDLIDAAADMLVHTSNMGLFSFGRERFSLANAAPDVQSDLEARIESLGREHDRALAANKNTTDDDYNDMFAHGDKEKGKRCKLSDRPYFESLEGKLPPGLTSVGDNFGDGDCNIFDATDDNFMPVRVNERKDNMCERVCKDKENQQGKSKDRVVGRLMDGISASLKATENVTLQSAHVAELGFVLSQVRMPESHLRFSTMNGTDPCDSGIQIPGDLIAAEAINAVIVGLDVAVIAGKIITEILETVKDVGEDACKQDVAGFNGSTGCIPLTVAVHISKGITDVLDGIKSGLGSTKDIILLGGEIVRSFQTDTLQTCAKGIKSDTDLLRGLVTGLQGSVDVLNDMVSGLQGAVAQTNDELAFVKSELAYMKSLLETNLELLLTPQGRREGFNH